MKNKRIYIAMLILSVSFLIGMYVLKIFFPEEFVMAIQNERIIQIGSFIDSHKWLYYIVYLSTGLVSDYLYFGAVCRKLKLDWKLTIIMLVYNTIFAVLYSFTNIANVNYLANVLIAFSMTYMIAIPALFTNELAPLSLTYSINTISQLLSLSIRDMSLLLTTNNIMTTILMSLECYFWLLLCFIVFNIKETKTTMGIVKPFYGNSKFYAKKKARTEKKIAKLQEVIKVCDEKLSSENK